MDLMPWKPFRKEIEPFRREMERLWDRFFGESFFSRPFAETWQPSADLLETETAIVVKSDLPGLDASDIDVSLSGDVLTIKGEKRKEEERSGERYHSVERYYGSFQRSFRLPAPVQTDKVEATFDKGVLTVTLPKTEEAKKKEIKVQVK
ncbi:MAG: Hsp20/alpha crystallin family protein [Deltaproteobacteria bacterium]|nr:Hsp20/alpha crystallin family protein [Deltaproteobacteria bacterium]